MVSALRSVSVTEEQVAGAKKQLLSDVYTLMEDPLQLVENMGVQVRVLSLLADTKVLQQCNSLYGNKCVNLEQLLIDFIL